MKTVMIAIVAVSVAALGAAGSLYYTGDLQAMFSSDQVTHGQAAEGAMPASAVPQEPIYLSLDPPFLVNVQVEGALRFLQVSIEVMAYDVATLESVNAHLPHIRNDILLTLSSQTLETLATAQAKQKLRATILQAVRSVLTQFASGARLEAVYFTSFVMQ